MTILDEYDDAEAQGMMEAVLAQGYRLDFREDKDVLHRKGGSRFYAVLCVKDGDDEPVSRRIPLTVRDGDFTLLRQSQDFWGDVGTAVFERILFEHLSEKAAAVEKEVAAAGRRHRDEAVF